MPLHKKATKPEAAPIDDGGANDPLVGVSLLALHPPRPTVGSPFQDVPYSFNCIQLHLINQKGFCSYRVLGL